MNLCVLSVVTLLQITWPWPRTWCFEFIPPGGLDHVPGVLNSLHLVAMAMYFVASSSFSLTFFRSYVAMVTYLVF